MSFESKFEYYYYVPSLAAAVVMTVAYALVLFGHLYQTIRHRMFYALIFSTGILMEVIGYIGRAINATEYPNIELGPYIIQDLFLLLPPTLFAAVIYMTLGRLVRSARGEFACPIRSTWLTPIFVTGDVLVFLLQASGGGLMTQASGFETGQHVVLAGIALQLLWFGLFVIVAFIWHMRMRAACLGGIHRADASNMGAWTKDLWILYAVSICIFIRSIYRVVEFAGGYSSYVMTQQWMFYIFDGLLMLIAAGLYTVWPPVRLATNSFKNNRSMLVSGDGATSDFDLESPDGRDVK